MNTDNNPQFDNSVKFSEFVQQKSNSLITGFVLKNFFIASFAFLIFGIITVPISYGYSILYLNYMKGFGFNGYIILSIVSPLVLLVLYWFAMSRWSRNIEGASNRLIIFNYIIESLYFIALLAPGIALLSVVSVQNHASATNGQVLNIIFQNAVIIFGGAWLAYLLPAAIGFFLKNAKIAKTLGQILVYSSIILIILVFVGFIIYFTRVGEQYQYTFNIIFTILWGVIVLILPIITIYQMKKVANFIDFNNKQAVLKWKAWFVFKIYDSMLMMAYFLLRILWYFKR